MEQQTLSQFIGKFCRIMTYMAGAAIMRPFAKMYIALVEKLKVEVEHD